jgi:hypothetical protein
MLYVLENTETEFTCPLHPTKKRTAYINEATEYAADMNLILAYQNLLDDWKDEKSYTKKAFVKILDKDYTRIVSKYPRQVRALEEFMRKTAEAEKNKETNLDLVAGLTGEMLGEIMCWREDEWQEEMRTLGFYMGKFIYLMDAYEDYEADQKKNCYNPLVYMEKENDQELIDRYRDFVPMFKNMAVLKGILKQKRMDRGAVNFEFPEAKVILELKAVESICKEHEYQLVNY